MTRSSPMMSTFIKRRRTARRGQEEDSAKGLGLESKARLQAREI